MTSNYLQTFLLGCEGPVSGTFRVRFPCRDIYMDGRECVRLSLEDYSGSVWAFSWDPEIINAFGIYDLSSVYIEGQVRIDGERVEVELEKVMPTEIHYDDIVRLIPQQLCPIPSLLPKLESALQLVTISALRQFVWQLLVDDSIALPFVSCPGSSSGYLNHPGGLLRYSLEDVGMVKLLGPPDVDESQLRIVGALFHDLGKILTLSPQRHPTSFGLSDDYGKLTTDVCGFALQQLTESWPDGGMRLRALLEWKAKRSIPHYSAAYTVVREDAAFDMGIGRPSPRQ
jgi:3'-5' exoribonuclease